MTAVVDAAVKVEVRNAISRRVVVDSPWRAGAIVTEIIEITAEIPEILKPHIADMRAGLKRFDQILANFTS
ncbi:MAG: hypothetical protein IPL59_16845 [Candidatus Competibacteraceae bacterium]|nr:hypothetical protein [Candidatus Competibacteraceae bacterium]